MKGTNGQDVKQDLCVTHYMYCACALSHVIHFCGSVVSTCISGAFESCLMGVFMMLL